VVKVERRGSGEEEEEEEEGIKCTHASD